MCDVPFGLCLSGGLDSSLVAAITMRIMRANPDKYGVNPILHTFSIGIKGESSDLVYAREVANFIGSEHHEIHFTSEDALNAIEDVIYHIESADITSVRASICNYLLARKIQSYGVKMVLSGEGSDEVLGGYLYFHQAPNDEAHQLECKMRVLDLGYFDCLRVDKSCLGNSVEVRVPFLDTEFVKLCINLNKDVKCQRGIEKYILRKAFDLKDSNGNDLGDTYNKVLECDKETCAKERKIFRENIYRANKLKKRIHIPKTINLVEIPDKEMLDIL